jgi:hypothetical protein
MRKSFAGGVALLAWLVGVAGIGHADAAPVLSVQPSAQTVAVGDTFTVAVHISGLGGGAGRALSAFDIDLGFGDAVLDLVDGSVAFGDQLDLGIFGSFRGDGPGIGTSVNVFEFSFEDGAVLDAAQASSFDLFSVSFLAIADGTSDLTLSVNSLVDSSLPANELVLDAVSDGLVTVGTSVPVPEPATLALVLVAGGAALGSGFRRKRLDDERSGGRGVVRGECRSVHRDSAASARRGRRASRDRFRADSAAAGTAGRRKSPASPGGTPRGSPSPSR